MNIADIINQPIEKYLHFFSAERQKKILRCKFNADRNRTIFAELLLRYEIGKKFPCRLKKFLSTGTKTENLMLSEIFLK